MRWPLCAELPKEQSCGRGALLLALLVRGLECLGEPLRCAGAPSQVPELSYWRVSGWPF